MTDKLWFLIPELILFAGVVTVVVMGLSPRRSVRDALPFITAIFLAIAFVVTPFLYTDEHVARAGMLMPMLGKFVKMIVCGVGIFLTMLTVGMIDRKYEHALEQGKTSFDPLRVNRGEFYAFMLLSLTGVMLCCSANDLIWLFLALELTSLPTYIMVAMSRPSKKAQEAAVKYFFLGAMASALFLYGFALLYGSTGTIVLTEMQDAFTQQRLETGGTGGDLNIFGTMGMILALLGVFYKIAAAPLHFYAADVYEGAAAPVTAFLAFVPKAAGMIAIMLLLGTVGWGAVDSGITGLPQPILTLLWMTAVLTMTLGNIGALLQKNVKRMLAYSSIAHSGYMLIGIIAGPAHGGLNAVLFYLFAYGVMNTAAFAVLTALERKGKEVETLDELAGLNRRHKGLTLVFALSAASLLGFPPLLGFIGKLYLFIAGVESGHIVLIVIAGLNSAISAWYYLALVKAPVLDEPNARSETVTVRPPIWPRVAALTGVILMVTAPFFSSRVWQATNEAVGMDTDQLDDATQREESETEIALSADRE